MMRKTCAGFLKEEVYVPGGDTEQVRDSDCTQAWIAAPMFDFAQNGGPPFHANIKVPRLQLVYSVIGAPRSPAVHTALSWSQGVEFKFMPHFTPGIVKFIFGQTNISLQA